MSPKLKKFLQRWMINTLAVAVAANVVRGISYDNGLGLFLASLLLGILNAFLRPILLILALPLLLATLGLFTLVINALLLFFVGNLLTSFHVRDFSSAFWGALVIGVISITMNILLGRKESKITFRLTRTKPPGGPPKDGGGPVIDV
jgi:putative membrane protein